MEKSRRGRGRPSAGAGLGGVGCGLPWSGCVWASVPAGVVSGLSWSGCVCVGVGLGGCGGRAVVDWGAYVRVGLGEGRGPVVVVGVSGLLRGTFEGWIPPVP